MTITQVKTSYQCRHDAAPGRCIVGSTCPNWSGLEPDDIRSIFGKDSSSILAARYYREKGEQKYRELRQRAMDQNPPLIPRETIPVSLRPPE